MEHRDSTESQSQHRVGSETDVLKNFKNKFSSNVLSPLKKYCNCTLTIWKFILNWSWWKNLLFGKQKPQTNAVYTSKYTFWSFIPKSLLYQFSRFSNIYFLSIGIMQLFPLISDSGGIPTALVPLSIVIVISSIKDLIEDLRRHRSDAEENNRPTRVCVNGQVVTRKWQDLRVGDIVKLQRGERVPADLVLLGTSGAYGVAYVETKNLDGETNLKHKVAVPEVSRFFTCDEEASTQKVKVNCEPPSALLYDFCGTINKVVQHKSPPFTSAMTTHTQNNEAAIQKNGLFHVLRATTQTLQSRIEKPDDLENILLDGSYPLRLGQFFLRGSSLVNTSWIYGLVVYVSKDTRIFQNANTQATFKWSHLEKTYNRHVLYLVLFEIIFCIVICIGASFCLRNQWYLGWPHQLKQQVNGDIYINQLSQLDFASRVNVVFTIFGSMIILFAYFVPIDLFLTLEIVRFVQALFMTWDLDLRCLEDDIRPISQSAHLLEELGNTTHIYTDKTGTLTKNLMVLRAIGTVDAIVGVTVNSVKGDATGLMLYNSDHSRKQNSAIRCDISLTSPRPIRENNKRGVEAPNGIPHVDRLLLSNEFCTLEARDIEVSLFPALTDEDIEKLKNLLLSFAVCHTVLIRGAGTTEADAHNVLNTPTTTETLNSENRKERHNKEPSLNNLAKDKNLQSSCNSTLKWPELPSELQNITPACIHLVRSENDPYWTIKEPPLAIYDASSPDELALVSTAQALGIEFFQRSQLDRIQLRLLTPLARKLILGERGVNLWNVWRSHANLVESYQNTFTKTELTVVVPTLELDLLDVLEFDNERKRMSVIIRAPWLTLSSRNTRSPSISAIDSHGSNLANLYTNEQQQCQSALPEDHIVLLSKGADTHMFSAAQQFQKDTIPQLEDNVSLLAQQGLRTLVFGERQLTRCQFLSFHQKLIAARSLTVAGQSPTVLNHLAETLEGIEHELILLGCTGVEDRLQAEVPNVIRELRSCDIKFWVLTGDKPETAINIGYATHLLTPETYNTVIDGTNRRRLERQLDDLREVCQKLNLLPQRKEKKDNLVSRTDIKHKANEHHCRAEHQIDHFLPRNSHSTILQTPTVSPNQQPSTKRFLSGLCTPCWFPNGLMPTLLSDSKICSSTALSTLDSEEFFLMQDSGDQLIFADCLRHDESICSGPITATTTPVVTTSSHDPLPTTPDIDNRHSILYAETDYDNYSHMRSSSVQPKIVKTESILEVENHDELQPGTTDYKLNRIYSLSSLKPAKIQKAEGPSSEFETPTVKEFKEAEADQYDKKTTTTTPIVYTDFSITVTGAALDEILKRRKLLIQFYRISRYASVVLACRVTPKQKCLLVKQSSALNSQCISSVAIGDGANDVAMILSANVGIGISGKEGLQAVRAADFGIGEFRFLRKLLLVHGREALRRNSFLIYYGIFKNIAFCVASFVYQFLCGFSGEDIYNFWIKSLYATVFVAPTVILYAVFDRELPHYILHRAPTIYRCLAPVMWPVADASTVMYVHRLWSAIRRRNTKVCRNSLWCCSLRRRNNKKNVSPRNLNLKQRFKEFWKERVVNKCPLPVFKKVLTKLNSAFTCLISSLQSLSCGSQSKKFQTVPVNARSYGTRLLLIWLTYAFLVGIVITILPLYVLNNAIPVDRRTFRRDIHYVGEQLGLLSPSATPLTPLTNNNTSIGLSQQRRILLIPYGFEEEEIPFLEEGKSGFDLPTVGMVVLLQCIVICNLIVLLAVNSLFWFQAFIMIATPALFLGLWALTSWQWLVDTAITGLQSISGTFRMIQKCPCYYFCMLLSIFICIIPIFSARVFKVLFEPNEVTIIKERMLQGVFDVVVGRRRPRTGELVVLVPQRQPLFDPHESEATSDILGSALPLNRTSLAAMPKSESSIDLPPPTSESQSKVIGTSHEQTVRPPPMAVPQSLPSTNPYHGFAFGYEETVISSPPSVWTLASLATWAGRTMGSPLIQIGRDVSQKLFVGFQAQQFRPSKFCANGNVVLIREERRSRRQSN